MCGARNRLARPLAWPRPRRSLAPAGTRRDPGAVWLFPGFPSSFTLNTLLFFSSPPLSLLLFRISHPGNCGEITIRLLVYVSREAVLRRFLETKEPGLAPSWMDYQEATHKSYPLSFLCVRCWLVLVILICCRPGRLGLSWTHIKWFSEWVGEVSRLRSVSATRDGSTG